MVVLGTVSAISIIVISILTIVIFGINVYYTRRAQQRARDLAADGESDISDPTTILYITNILGILLSIIILGILIYLYVKSTTVGSKLITDIQQGVKNLPTKIKTYTSTSNTQNSSNPIKTFNATTENVD